MTWFSSNVIIRENKLTCFRYIEMNIQISDKLKNEIVCKANAGFLLSIRILYAFIHFFFACVYIYNMAFAAV